MKNILFLLFTLFCPLFLFAQLHDNIWLVGYGGPPSGDKFGLSMLQFKDGNIKVSEGSDVNYEFYGNTSMCSDANGKLFAYFNGIDLHNAAHKIMQNGKGFDKEIVEFYRYYSDDAIAQGSFFLEWPDHPDSILLLYLGKAYIDGLDSHSQNFSYAVIDRKANNGLGKVVAREQSITEDTTTLQTIAVKHANGRDWWVPIRELNGTRFYYFLVNPSGIKFSHLQTVAIPVIHGLDVV